MWDQHNVNNSKTFNRSNRKAMQIVEVPWCQKWCLHKICLYLTQGGQSVCIGAQCSFQESKSDQTPKVLLDRDRYMRVRYQAIKGPKDIFILLKVVYPLACWACDPQTAAKSDFRLPDPSCLFCQCTRQGNARVGAWVAKYIWSINFFGFGSIFLSLY